MRADKYSEDIISVMYISKYTEHRLTLSVHIVCRIMNNVLKVLWAQVRASS